MSNTVLTPSDRKTPSDMLRSFKQNANPYYHENFGLSLNNVNFWQKNTNMQFIVVWAGGSQFTFIGDDARSVLYNLGDRDSTKFRTLTEDEKIAVMHYLNGTSTEAPVAEPVEA